MGLRHSHILIWIGKVRHSPEVREFSKRKYIHHSANTYCRDLSSLLSTFFISFLPLFLFLCIPTLDVDNEEIHRIYKLIPEIKIIFKTNYMVGQMTTVYQCQFE